MEINLDLITVNDQSVLRAIKHVRTQPYKAAAIEKDPTKANKKVCIFNIGGKVFNADSEDEVSKIILENRQAELYSISFTKGEKYTDKKGVEQDGINFSSFLTKKQRQEDIDFEQDIIIAQSRGDLHVLEQKARIRKDYFVNIDDLVTLPSLEAAAK